jgi:hypothetical protein
VAFAVPVESTQKCFDSDFNKADTAHVVEAVAAQVTVVDFVLAPATKAVRVPVPEPENIPVLQAVAAETVIP